MATPFGMSITPITPGKPAIEERSFPEAAFQPYWLEQRWKDKIAAGFTNSASQSGDKLSTLLQLTVFAMQMGMIWVGVILVRDVL